MWQGFLPTDQAPLLNVPAALDARLRVVVPAKRYMLASELFSESLSGLIEGFFLMGVHLLDLAAHH